MRTTLLTLAIFVSITTGCQPELAELPACVQAGTCGEPDAGDDTLDADASEVNPTDTREDPIAPDVDVEDVDVDEVGDTRDTTDEPDLDVIDEEELDVMPDSDPIDDPPLDSDTTIEDVDADTDVGDTDTSDTTDTSEDVDVPPPILTLQIQVHPNDMEFLGWAGSWPYPEVHYRHSSEEEWQYDRGDDVTDETGLFYVANVQPGDEFKIYHRDNAFSFGGCNHYVVPDNDCGEDHVCHFEVPRIVTNMSRTSWDAPVFSERHFIQTYCITNETHVPESVQIELPECLPTGQVFEFPPPISLWMCLTPLGDEATVLYIGEVFSRCLSPLSTCDNWVSGEMERDASKIDVLSSEGDDFRMTNR